jgi:hypothetical protein
MQTPFDMCNVDLSDGELHAHNQEQPNIARNQALVVFFNFMLNPYKNVDRQR